MIEDVGSEAASRLSPSSLRLRSPLRPRLTVGNIVPTGGTEAEAGFDGCFVGGANVVDTGVDSTEADVG